MITNEQLATQIETKLNPEILRSSTVDGVTVNEYCAGNINGRPFAFKVHSNNGEYQAFAADGTQRNRSTVLVNAVLGEQISTPLPLQGLGSTLISQTLSFIIPIDLDKRTGSADYAIQAINLFVQDVAGLAGTIIDEDDNRYSYVLSVSSPFVGQESYVVGTQSGRVVPATCNVQWQIVLNGVVGNNISITLDGQKLLLLDGAGTRTGVGTPTNIANETEQKTVLTQQGLLFDVVIPYKRGNVTVNGVSVRNISQQLMYDKLNGILEKVYTMTWDDNTYENGVSLNDGLTWSGRVVATEISAPYTAGKGVVIKARFVIARDE